MKKALWFLPLLLVMLITTGCSEQLTEPPEIEMYGYDGGDKNVITKENDSYALDFYPATTEIVLRNKLTGEEMRSNPEDAVSDPMAASDIAMRNTLQSQFTLTYANINNVENTLPNYQFSVAKGMYNFTEIPNGFEVNYTLGNIERPYMIPYAVPEQRMMEFYSQFEKKDQRKIDEYYRIIDINKLRADDDKDLLIATYPDLVDTRIYVLYENNPAHIKVQMETLFEAFGYTQEDYEEDMARYEGSNRIKVPVFNVTVRYELEGNDLVVTVPFENLHYNPEYPIVNLRILPYFGAGSLEDEGFLFVPDSAGAIINFNNGKHNMDPFVTNVYGWDVGMLRETLVHDNRATMPVFGIQNNDTTMLCIIEEGAPYAIIDADVSRRRSSYNNVAARYIIVHGETMDISAKSDKTIMMFQTELPAEKIVQRYSFCEKDGYMGMAEHYRNYLMKTQGLGKMQTASTPAAVEITGAANKTRFILGLPADMPLKLTSYQEALDMVNDLNSRGWSDISYKLTGWFNDSVNHTVPSKIRTIGDLGSKKDLSNLASAINGKGNDLYLEADFMYMKDNNPFDGFSIYDDAARYLNRKHVTLYPYAISSFVPADWLKLSYFATPAYTLNLIDSFAKNIETYGTTNIAFRNLGQKLAGNYNEKDPSSRTAVMDMQSQKLRELQQNGSKTMIKEGNAYALAGADFITDLILPGSSPTITDASIPFNSLVLHGLIPFAGGPLNLASDYYGFLMRTVEAGAGLYFSFMTENAFVLQDSLYYEYYANEYGKWIDEADEIYQTVGKDLEGVSNQFITDHQLIHNGIVTKTVYEDGTAILVNHGTAPYTHEGQTIPSRDYVIVKGGNAS